MIISSILKNTFLKFMNILYPERCPACDDILGPDEISHGFCKKCSRLIKRVGQNVCQKCGRVIKEDAEYCTDCRKKEHSFEQAKAVYEYAEPMKQAMYRFKYNNRRTYGKIFAEDAGRMYADWVRSVSPAVIIPVPMYIKKQKVRGYNQAAEFGTHLSKSLGIPIAGDAVRRIKDTPALKKLGAKDRFKSLRNAFRCTKVFRKKADILLVDDIFTTGATADAVADALISAGAGRIYCLFVCIGVGDNKGGSNYGSQKLQDVPQAFQLPGGSEYLP